MPVQNVPFLRRNGILRLVRNQWDGMDYEWEVNYPFHAVLTIHSWSKGMYEVRREGMHDKVYWLTPTYLLELMQAGLVDGNRVVASDWVVVKNGSSYCLKLNA